jgi:hypothetical protein
MLKTVECSRGNKTKGLAITYRAGGKNKFGTCPLSCKLNASGKGCKPQEVDKEYLDVIWNSKPKDGEAFIYTHFDPKVWFKDFTQEERNNFGEARKPGQKKELRLCAARKKQTRTKFRA